MHEVHLIRSGSRPKLRGICCDRVDRIRRRRRHHRVDGGSHGTGSSRRHDAASENSARRLGPHGVVQVDLGVGVLFHETHAVGESVDDTLTRDLLPGDEQVVDRRPVDGIDLPVVRGKEDLLPVRTVEVDEEAPIRIRVHVERVARREHVVGIECPDPHHALRERKRGRKRLLAPVRAVLAPDAAEASILSENPDVVVADPGDVDHFDGRRLVGRIGPDAARTDEQSRRVDVLAGGVDGAVRRHPDATHGLRNERSARKRFVGPGPIPVRDRALSEGRDRHVDVVRR